MAKKFTLPLFTQLKQYLQTSIKLLKYEAIDTGSSLISGIVVDILMLFFLLGGFLFLSIALAAFAANILHSWPAAMAAVAGFYVLVALCVPLLRKPLQNLFVRYFIFKFQHIAKPWILKKPNRTSKRWAK